MLQYVLWIIKIYENIRVYKVTWGNTTKYILYISTVPKINKTCICDPLVLIKIWLLENFAHNIAINKDIA